MKKIGLVTCYDRGPNYGTTLQAFALQNYIKKCNFDCEIIKYENKNLLYYIKHLILNCYLYIFKHKLYKKNKIINKWIKEKIELSQKKFTPKNLKELNNRYDFFVCRK